MKVVFPKGFLDKLSKKSREELLQAASQFEFETEMQETIYSPTYIGYESRKLIHTDKGIFNGEVLKYCRTSSTSIVRIKGFDIAEDSMVSAKTRSLISLEEKADELENLKKSMGSIRKALGDL